VSSGARRLAAGRLRAQSPVITCEEAREAISACLDREWHPALGAALEGHLANCPACRGFQADVASLQLQGRLRSPKPVPDDLVSTLASLLKPGRRPLLALVRRWCQEHGLSSGWARTVRWTVAVVPAVIVSVALPLGVGSQPRLVPTRPPSPCTVGLVTRHLTGGG
jgi:predicted anti-sigma-YlaC factor YlaD